MKAKTFAKIWKELYNCGNIFLLKEIQSLCKIRTNELLMYDGLETAHPEREQVEKRLSELIEAINQ